MSSDLPSATPSSGAARGDVSIRRSLATRRATSEGTAASANVRTNMGVRGDGHRQPRSDINPGRTRVKTETAISLGDPLNVLIGRLAKRMDIDVIDPAAMKNQERWSAARAAIAETFLAMQTDGLVHENLDMRELAHKVLHEAVGLGPLDDLLSDDNVRAIVVNGPKTILVDRGSGLETAKLEFSSTEALLRIAQRVAADCGQALENQSVLYGRLSFGPNATILQPPLANHGLVLELSMHNSISLEQLTKRGWMADNAAAYLANAVSERRNIVVAGTRGSGVTEVMSALVRVLPSGDRCVTIEKNPELENYQNHVISLTTASVGMPLKEAIEHGARLRTERLAINDLCGAETIAALTVALGREPGHLLGIHCGPATHAIDGVLLAAGSAGAGREYVAQLFAAVVDVVVTMHRSPEGPRLRELLEVQDHHGTTVNYTSVPI